MLSKLSNKTYKITLNRHCWYGKRKRPKWNNNNSNGKKHRIHMFNKNHLKLQVRTCLHAKMELLATNQERANNHHFHATFNHFVFIRDYESSFVQVLHWYCVVKCWSWLQKSAKFTQMFNVVPNILWTWFENFRGYMLLSCQIGYYKTYPAPTHRHIHALLL